MKEKNEIASEYFTKKRVKFLNKDITVFAFFLLLSFLFWYLNSLGKEIEADVRYPVRYINIPEGQVIVEEQPARLNLSLKGPGYSILKLKLSGKRKPIIIDVSSVSLKRVQAGTGLNYFIVTSGINKSLITQLKSDCELTSVKPDTLFLILDVKATEPDVDSPDNEDVNEGD